MSSNNKVFPIHSGDHMQPGTPEFQKLTASLTQVAGAAFPPSHPSDQKINELKAAHKKAGVHPIMYIHE